MKKIENYLESKLYIVEQKKVKRQYYNLTSSSKKSVEKLINYLEKYPLKTSKYLDYQNFKEVSLYVREKRTKEKLKEIKELKREMNKSRTKFN
jgi:hypothetical protein